MGPGVKVAGDGYAHPRPRGRPPRPRPTVHGGRDARPQARAARGLGRLRGGHVPGRGRVRVAVLRRVLHYAPPRAHPLVRDAARVARPPHGGCLRLSFPDVRAARGGAVSPLSVVFALALVSHILLDWITSWGTMFLSPISSTRFTLDWTFIL